MCIHSWTYVHVLPREYEEYESQLGLKDLRANENLLFQKPVDRVTELLARP